MIIDDPDKVSRRILARIRKVLVIPDLGECWEWQGNVQSKGYGTIKIKNRTFTVHKLMYVIWIRDVEDGHLVCHKCHNRRCCRPKHLYQGTNLDNARDLREKIRSWVQGQPPQALRRRR